MHLQGVTERIVRQQVNESDKSTIVSIYPVELNERKETIEPGFFHLDAGSLDKPSVLVVGSSSWWAYVGENMPKVEIPHTSLQIAQSVKQDYCNCMLMISPDAEPGIFYVYGEFTAKEIKEKFTKELKEAERKQRNWFHKLVQLADTGWARTNGNPMAISDLMRTAAKELGVTDRSWMESTMETQKVPCVACGNLRNPKYPICGSCNRIVDAALAEKLGIKAA